MKKIEFMHFDKKKVVAEIFLSLFNEEGFSRHFVGLGNNLPRILHLFLFDSKFCSQIFLNFRFRQEVNLGVNEAGVAFLTCSNIFFLSFSCDFCDDCARIVYFLK